MELIGLLDSPYVRRVAISLQMLNLDFSHRPLSVFRDKETFKSYNPLVKAPTLIANGTTLIDSQLILDYAETLAGRSLMSSDPRARLFELRILGLALAAMEKSVQIYYETAIRSHTSKDAEWLARISEQLTNCYSELERAFAALPEDDLFWNQATISSAVAWYFTQETIPGYIETDSHPHISALSEQAEYLPEFKRAAYGDQQYPIDIA